MSDIRAVVAGHGDFPAGIVSAVEQITGREDVFEVVSNRGLSAQDVEVALRAQVEGGGIQVIFTDLPAGSCTMAARRLQRQMPSLTVVTGVNLAALLDFVFSDATSAQQAAVDSVEKGRLSLMVTGGGGAIGGTSGGGAGGA